VKTDFYFKLSINTHGDGKSKNYLPYVCFLVLYVLLSILCVLCFFFIVFSFLFVYKFTDHSCS
jgi:hypothetical protein